MALCSIVKVDVAGRRCRRAAGVLARAEDPGRAAGRHRRERPRRVRALPRARLHLLPGRVLRQAARCSATAASRRRASAPCAALGELTAGDVSFEDLERIIASDVGLSLKLLRYVNSAFFALPRTVCSVREALSLLGVRTVRRWATVMAISAIPDVPRRARRAGAAPRPHVRDARRQRAARGARDALHDRPVLGRRRAAGRADGRGPRLAAVLRGDPGRAAAPRGPEGRAARGGHRLRARRVPDADGRRRSPASRWPVPTAPRSSGPTRPAARSPKIQ